MVNQRGQFVIGVIGASLIAAFFLPWFTFGGLLGASGYDLVARAALPELTRLAVILCPLSGLALIASVFVGEKAAARTALAVGAGMLLYAAVQTLRIVIFTTGSGLWITVAAAGAALVVGAFALHKRR
jgi:hypothetical protein